MSNAKNIVMVPGLLCDEALWQFQIPLLKEAGYNIFIPKPTNKDTISALADEVLGQAPARFTLMGLSMGGYICLEIMRKAPERVAKLIITNSSAREDTPETKRRRRALISMAKIGKFKGVTPKLLPLLIHPDRLDDDDLTQIIMDMAERVGRDAFENQQKAILSRVDSRESLKEIECETLIIGGDEDAITPVEMAEEMAELIANTRLTIVKGCGHLAPLEKPDQFNDLLTDFID